MKWTKQPRINRKTKQQDGWRYEFWRYSEAKQRYDRVLVSALPKHVLGITSDDDAEAYCKLKGAEEGAIKARIEKRLQWQSQFHDFNTLVKKYAKQQMEKAPNSWKNDVFYLETYALPFFLLEKQLNNVLEWPMHFDSFRDHLKAVKPFKVRRERLAFNTQNRIIKALNRFLDLNAKGLGQPILKCSVYPRKVLREITASDIPDETEIANVARCLKVIRPESHLLYTVIVRTGLRINEALGLCLAFVRDGQIDGAKSRNLHRQLEMFGLGNYHGYICLESQPSLDKLRSEDGTVPRKPLKLRPTISAKYFRYIPVFDKNAWNIIVDQWEIQSAYFDQKKNGIDKRDYLLFNGITAAMFYNDVVKAYEMAGLVKKKSPHKLRHFYLNWFYDMASANARLAEAVGGHRDQRTIENYSHVAEQIGQEQMIKELSVRKLKRAV